MLTDIKQFSDKFLKKTTNKKIQIISHFDTDGITSSAILTKTLERLEKHFSTKIVKALNQEEIDQFPDDKIILFHIFITIREHFANEIVHTHFRAPLATNYITIKKIYN